MHKRITSLAMALMGLALFTAFVAQDIRIHPEIAPGDLPWGLILRYGAAMTLGGALAGYLFAGFFGRGGVLGWVPALIGGVIAASISGLLGSAFGLLPDLLADGFSTADAVQMAAGLLILPLAAAEQPWILAVLVVLVALTQFVCLRRKS